MKKTLQVLIGLTILLCVTGGENTFGQNYQFIEDLSSIEGCECGKKFVINKLQLPTQKESLSSQSKEILKNISKKIGEWGGAILIEGHADVTHTPQKSYVNSNKRANIVKDFFINHGIPSENIVVSAKGEFEPPYASEPQSHKNRTVTFQIISCPSPRNKPLIARAAPLKFATATSGGTYYAAGRVLAAMWSDKLEEEGIAVEVRQTQGSPHNLELLYNDEVALAISTVSVAKKAFEDGIEALEGKPYKNLSALLFLWDNVQHFVINASKSESGTAEDLKKIDKFCVGREKSSNAFAANIILDGLEIKGIERADCGSYNETVQNLRQGGYDGGSFAGGVPVRAVEDLLNDNNFRILEFNEIQRLQAGFPSYKIEANTYPNQPKPIHTLTEPNILVVNKKLDEEIVKLLLKEMVSNIKELGWGHKALRAISFEDDAYKEAFGEEFGGKRKMPVPLHPAVKPFVQSLKKDNID